MNSFAKLLPRTPGRWLVFIILVLATLFYLMPVYIMVVNGLKEAQNVSLSTMWQLPESLTGGGFKEAWQRLSPNMLNSLFMVIPATVTPRSSAPSTAICFQSGNFAARISSSLLFYLACSFHTKAF